MTKYRVNTPIKVDKKTIIKPGPDLVDLSEEIVESLPAGAVTAVDVSDRAAEKADAKPKPKPDAK